MPGAIVVMYSTVTTQYSDSISYQPVRSDRAQAARSDQARPGVVMCILYTTYLRGNN